MRIRLWYQNLLHGGKGGMGCWSERRKAPYRNETEQMFPDDLLTAVIVARAAKIVALKTVQRNLSDKIQGHYLVVATL